ncbi:MAG: type II secretion system protein [Planctomycetes bacterium]|nr:type II secretion system protein [Planctomycetota bacterium]
MKVRKKMARMRRRGFTLVELLVVVAIIGILMSGAVMVGSYVIQNAKIQQTKSVMSALDAAIKQYQLYHASTNTELPLGNLPPQLVIPPLTDPPSINPPSTGLYTDFNGIVALYNALNDVPDCREILDSISKNNIVLYGTDKILVDSWMNENINQLNWLRYEYVQGSGNFPVIRSAGPDLQYGTGDDILSTEIEG